MQQKSCNHWRLLGFFSRKLTDTESRYSTFDRELLAAHAAIKHFRHFCEGRQFQLWTDHKPLVSALTRVSVPISPRQQRQLAFISEFNIQMLYLPGLKNVVADFLSRPSPPEPTGNVAAAAAADPVDFKAMTAEQNNCAEFSVCSAEHLSNLPFTKQALTAWLGMFQQAFFVPLSRKSSIEIFS
jgi:cleavage and polyadenylation specificity factor subunit 1